MSDTKATVYVAGPMRNYSYYNFPAFDSAKEFLESHGWTVLSPADMDREDGFDALEKDWPADYDWGLIPDGFDFQACVTRDIEAVRKCDAIYMLEGWTKSKGAMAEYALAVWLGKQIIMQGIE
jgi:nucleoside 2-deoxyribosyltransferase